MFQVGSVSPRPARHRAPPRYTKCACGRTLTDHRSLIRGSATFCPWAVSTHPALHHTHTTPSHITAVSCPITLTPLAHITHLLPTREHPPPAACYPPCLVLAPPHSRQASFCSQHTSALTRHGCTDTRHTCTRALTELPYLGRAAAAGRSYS